ncbi:hypothetical protein [Kitasatospora sp. GAS204B]|uniref:hypothetical protein n=1 Tax=unclassified Kitasatospora TaxID=2633591 RepID=UPI0024768C2F|nr:hypothetical protein [Kitasatospora sp. GAS204B]MDH6119711.1 hypothetical protein [Kitasatospora sp. GAS204B]
MPPQTSVPLVLPIGQDLGPAYEPGDTESESPIYGVRIGVKRLELTEPLYVAWRYAHGVGPLNETPWTEETYRQALQESAVDFPEDVAGLLKDLGLVQTVAPGGIEAARFARAYRCNPQMVGLGNVPDRPEVFYLGLPEQPVLAVPAAVYALWVNAPLEPSLWSGCAAMAAELNGYLDATPPNDGVVRPETLLALFLATMPHMLLTRTMYLDVSWMTGG